jgi:hypothetical protein
VLTGLLTGPLSAVVAPTAWGAPTDCPDAYPLSQVAAGQTGTGYTVEQGTTPQPFGATVLGVVTDGIAPGVDLIMAQLSSDALTRAGGVWEGMSGSPVYAADGRLIGSVSYGLASPSSIAGLTPAAGLDSLLTTSAASAPSAPARIGAAAVKRGFRPLALPAAVSGVRNLDSPFLARLSRNTGLDVRVSGAGIPRAAASASDISAGGNFAAAIAYGDVSMAAIGTTTMVCDGQAVAFGHPFEGLGAVQFSAQPATAVYVQPDPLEGPFKVANPGGPAGVVDGDRTLGLHARLGATPSAAFDITSSIATPGGTAVTGTTTDVYQPAAPDVAAMHLETEIGRVLEATGGGTANLRFTIKGTTPDDGAFSLTRSDAWADSADIGYTAADALYSLVDSVADQDWANVTFTGIAVTGTVSSTVQHYRVTGMKVWSGGRWITQRGTLKGSAGKTLKTQVALAKYRSSATVHVTLTVKVPAGSQGSLGRLQITDGENAGVATPKVTGFPTLLTQLAAVPPSNALAGAVTLEDAAPFVTLKKLDAPVSDYSKGIALRIRD